MKDEGPKRLPQNRKSSKRTQHVRYLNIIAKKFNRDKDYRDRMLSSYSFAKKELSKAGLEINPKFYRKIGTGYKLLTDAAAKVVPGARVYVKIERSLFKEALRTESV